MHRIPLWIKVAYSVWFVVWVVIYADQVGVENFLWICDLANFILLLALWRESALLFSSQAVAVLLIQAVWAIDFFGRLALGFHPIGGTEYMFDAAEPLIQRSMSLFHLWVPLLLLWGVYRLGYDRRAPWLQAAILWLALPATLLLTDPERNINWLWGPFGLDQTLMPPWLYLLLCMAVYPLVLLVPVHWLLKAWARRSPRVELLPPAPTSA